MIFRIPSAGLLAFLVLGLISIANSEESVKESTNSNQKSKLINAQVYTKLFLRHREEQKTLLNHIRGIEDYAKRYKLLSVGLLQILDVVKDNQRILLDERYSPLDGFPTQERTIDSVVLILENTFLFGDLLLHMPDMSYKILGKRHDWRSLMNWALDFAAHFETPIFDDGSRKLLSLTDQEINADKRTADYVNPYSEDAKQTAQVKPKQQRKKIRKGPQLGGGGGASRNEL